jgi:hypothetical protein
VELGAAWLDDFQAARWYNYSPVHGQDKTGYIPMYHGYTDNYWTAIGAAGVPTGSWHMVLNEPEGVYQDNLTAAQAATEYHRIRDVILGVDPAAKIVVGNFVNMDLSGYHSSGPYILAMRASYLSQFGVAMPSEAIGAHLYLCGADYSTATYRNKITQFRQWMLDNNIPGELWLTETGCLSNTTTAALIMNEQLSWLKTNTDISMFFWFASYYTGGSGSLLNSNGTKTTLGNLYDD